jgi:hypothetical protein
MYLDIRRQYVLEHTEWVASSADKEDPILFHPELKPLDDIGRFLAFIRF